MRRSPRRILGRSSVLRCAHVTDGQEVGVTPWEVSAKGPKGVDYGRVLETFKSQPVTESLISRFESVVRQKNSDPAYQAHHFLRRGIAFSHRDLDGILDEVESGRQFFLYTGRGPSSASMHIGHVVPFLLCKHLQKTLQLPFVIQITDDEKFLFRDLELDKLRKITHDNIKDIIAFGFDPKLTFIFQNSRYMGTMYPTVLEIQRLFTANMMKNTFGFSDTDNVGKFAFPAIQAAPCFSSSFPNVLPLKTKKLKCLVPCAIDQDPFFVLTRNIADRLKRPKPALLHTKFVPALKGLTHKMSSSAEQNGTILLSDDTEVIKKKIQSSFSGGHGTMEMLREKGANLDIDVPYQLLRYFEADDEQLNSIGSDYSKGVISTRAVKDRAFKAISELVGEIRERRRLVTDEDVSAFMLERNIMQPAKA